MAGDLKITTGRNINNIENVSRGGLEVEAWTDNCLHSASVGLNPAYFPRVNVLKKKFDSMILNFLNNLVNI